MAFFVLVLVLVLVIDLESGPKRRSDYGEEDENKLRIPHPALK